MKISIDCRMIDSSGIGVYLKGCLPFFLDSSNDFLLFGDSKKIRELTKSHTNIQIINCAIKTFSVRELFFFPNHLLDLINQTDLYYSPFFNIPSGITVPVYTTIHDIIFPDMPELISKPGLMVRMFFYRRAAKISKKLFTVSGFSKSRIEYHLGVKKPVIVTHIALQAYLQKKTIIKQEKNDIILFIGNIKKHKGLSILLDAFAEARGEGLKHKLVIVGSKDNFRSRDEAITQKIKNMDKESVEFTSFINDLDLKNLLAGASLLVQPSLYEGFGLPPLEAMSLGTRVLISDIPVFKEIYAEFPVTFFRAGNAVDLKEKMIDLLVHGNKQPIILPDYLRNKYTFRKTASIIMDELNSQKI
jgi:glycosyltransferase involved in cell wall biosynthesis